MKDYKAIFEAIETSLIDEGSKHLSIETIRANLDWFKQLEGKNFSNNEYFRIIVAVIFYSGFRAATVNSRISTSRKLKESPKTGVRSGRMPAPHPCFGLLIVIS